MNKPDAIVLQKFCELLFEFCRLPEIVSVLERNKFACRLPDTAIPCRAYAGIILTHVLNPLAKLPHDRLCIIRRTVVNYNYLRGRMRLSQNAANRFCDESSIVVRRDND